MNNYQRTLEILGSLLLVFVFAIASVLLKDFVKLELKASSIHSSMVWLVGDILVNLSVIISAMLFIMSHHMTVPAGLGGTPLRRRRLLVIPLVLILLYSERLILNVESNVPELMLLLMWGLSVGFFEELVFRGFLQTFLLRRLHQLPGGIYLGVAAPSLLVAGTHLYYSTGGIWEDLSLFFVELSVGMLFGMLLLQTKRLLPLALLHGLYEFGTCIPSAAMLTQETFHESTIIGNYLKPALVILPFLIFSLYWLSKVTSGTIERMHEDNSVF